MSKAKFKVGDRVEIVKIIGSPEKKEYIGKTFEISSYDGMKYGYYLKGLDGVNHGWCYSDEELELITENCTYTGIELLQAIKDGVFKDGDKFKVYLNGTNVDEAEILGIGYKLQIKSDWLPKGNFSLDDMLNCVF